MENIEKILDEINGLKLKYDAKKIKMLQIERLTNIVNKLTQYSDNCSDCRDFLGNFERDFLDNVRTFDKALLRSYMINLKKIQSHLCKKHKHVMPGTYLGTYMSIGMTFGMSIGMMIGSILDNNGSGFGFGMSMGMCFGMCIGMAIGSLMDADAKKKGRQI